MTAVSRRTVLLSAAPVVLAGALGATAFRRGAAGSNGTARLPAGTTAGSVGDSRVAKALLTSTKSLGSFGFTDASAECWGNELAGGRLLMNPYWCAALNGTGPDFGATCLAPRALASGIVRVLFIQMTTNWIIGTHSAEEIAAQLALMRDQCTAAGVIPVFVLESPRVNETAAQKAKRLRCNAIVRGWRDWPDKGGSWAGAVDWLDPLPYTADANGDALTTIYVGDDRSGMSVHRNREGAYQAGKGWRDWIMARVAPATGSAPGEGANLIADSSFARGPTGRRAGGAAGVVPDGCTLALAGSGMTVAASRPAPGRIVLTVGGAGEGSATFTIPATAIAAGNSCIAALRIETTGAANINVAFALSVGDILYTTCTPSPAATTAATNSPGGPRAVTEDAVRECRSAVVRATAACTPAISVTISASAAPGQRMAGQIMISLPRIHRVPAAVAARLDHGATRRIRIVFPAGASLNGRDVGLAGIGLKRSPADPDFIDLDVSGAQSPGAAAGTFTSLADRNPDTAWRCGAGLLASGEQFVEYRLRTFVSVGAVVLTAVSGADWSAISPTAFRLEVEPLSGGGRLIDRGTFRLGRWSAGAVRTVAIPA